MSTHLLRSELLNLGATATAKVLLAASMLMAAISLLANLATVDSAELGSTATIERVMHASTVATLTFALIAGIVSSTTDYRFGRMDQLLLSEPRSSRVLATKTVTGFMLGVVYGLAGGAVALAVLAAYYRFSDVAVDLTSSVVLRPLAGSLLACGLFVVFGIGLGTAVRNQPAALGIGLAVLLVLQPPLLIGLPELGRLLPGAAGLSMTLAPDEALFGQLAGTVLLVGWAFALIVIGDRRLRALGA